MSGPTADEFDVFSGSDRPVRYQSLPSVPTDPEILDYGDVGQAFRFAVDMLTQVLPMFRQSDQSG